MARMAAFVAEHLSDRRGHALKVLDVGGANINGSYRDVFDDPAWTYVALDVEPSEAVDVVPKRPWRWQDVPARSYDVVVSGQAFEHVLFPWVTMLEIRRVLRPGGLLCLVAPSTGPEHRYPQDCWRFYRDGLVALASWADMAVVDARVHADGARWPDDSPQWNDAVLVAQRIDLGGVRGAAGAIKRAALRFVGSFNAERRGPDAHATADDLAARDPGVTPTG